MMRFVFARARTMLAFPFVAITIPMVITASAGFGR